MLNKIKEQSQERSGKNNVCRFLGTKSVEFMLDKKCRKFVQRGDVVHLDGEDFQFDGKNWKHIEGKYVPKSDKPEFSDAYTRMLEARNKILSERMWIIEKAERKAFQKGLALGSAAMWTAYIIGHLIGGML